MREISVEEFDARFDELMERIAGFVSNGTRQVDLRLPLDRADLLARLHREGAVQRADYDEDGVRIRATVPDRSMETWAAFEISRPSAEPVLPAVR